MAIRKILLLGNPALREKSDKVHDLSNESKVLVDLKDTLTHLQSEYGMGRGIAAPQIGYRKQVLFLQMTDRSFYLVNPKIISRSSETFEVWDSCFSMKVKFFVKIPRNKSVTVEYFDEKNVNHIEEFRDGLSELLQHEIDHLDGILCSDHIKDPKDIVMYEEWLTRYREQGIGM